MGAKTLYGDSPSPPLATAYRHTKGFALKVHAKNRFAVLAVLPASVTLNKRVRRKVRLFRRFSARVPVPLEFAVTAVPARETGVPASETDGFFAEL